MAKPVGTHSTNRLASRAPGMPLGAFSMTSISLAYTKSERVAGGARTRDLRIHNESISFATDAKHPESDHAPVVAEFELPEG